ncbi:hypothetical protein [Variovorax sp. DAIF25]|uniref:hypothetical protein n=1 Tax=Variovorax sp. DAIF25 TaxID=3080983 RepID=UPI003D6B4D23
MNIDNHLLALESLSVWSCSGACSYAFSRLPASDTLLNSLVDHLKLSRQYQERFPLQLFPLDANWRPAVESFVFDWVFGAQPSSGPGAAAQNAVVVRELVGGIGEKVGDAAAFMVMGEGTMVPNTIWNAIAFTSAEASWLLEFGWDD